MKKRSVILSLIVSILISASLFAQNKEYTVEAIQKDRSFFGKAVQGVQWYDKGEKYSFLKVDTAASTLAIFAHDVKTG